MKTDDHWIDDIVAAFLRLPRGLRRLTPEIYDAVKHMRGTRGIALPNCWDACIRQILPMYSSQYPHRYHPDKPDYFISGGPQSGLWGLRDEFWPRAESTPQLEHPGDIWIETPQDGYWRYEPGVLRAMALPETIREFNFLREYTSVCNERDPRIGIRVMLYNKQEN